MICNTVLILPLASQSIPKRKMIYYICDNQKSDLSSSPPKMSQEWTIKEIHDLVEKRFNKRPCWYQIKAALALHAGKDVITCAATGAGKTLSFWIALLMAMEEGEDKMIIVVTPLNLLGKQNVDSLCQAGLCTIAVSSENANATVYKVSTFFWLFGE